MSVAIESLVESVARAAVTETAGDESSVGGLGGVVEIGDGLVSVRYECLLPGYRGWEWTVDVAVVDGAATVCESALLPGEQALLAPQWVPWSDRVRPGDLEPGMVLPYIADDERLVPGYTATGDEDLDHMAIYEFGLGRERVLAPEAREAVADRWYRGSHGPSATPAVASAAACSTCAFWVPITGSFRMLFGACANEWSPSDGRVVSVDHGCGAHSQTEAERRLSEWPGVEPVVDSGAIEALDLLSEPEPEAHAELETAEQNEPADVDVDASEPAVAEAPPEVVVTEAVVTEVVFTEVVFNVVTIDGGETRTGEPAADESPKDEAAAE